MNIRQYTYAFMLGLLSHALSGQDTWHKLLLQKRHAMGEATYALLNRQHEAYREQTAPSIASHCIKQIPIQENHETLVDIATLAHPRIRVMEGEELLQVHDAPEDVDTRSTHYSKVRQGVFQALIHMITELDAVAPFFGYEVGELEIRLSEGLRDLATQKALFDALMQRLLQEHPTWTEQQAYEEASRWVSPYKDNVPVHSTGGAVDIHLWSNKHKAFCPMGRFNKGGSAAPLFSTDASLSNEEMNNRLLQAIAATRAGLTSYVYEFWHFSYGDRYAAYWRIANPEDRYALYSSVGA